MGILGELFGVDSKDTVSAIDAVGNTLDQLFTSDEEREQAKAVMAKIAMQPSVLQGEINKIESQHRSVFVAGWRPFIGWVCGIGLLNAFILNPYFEVFFGVTIPVPISDMTTLVISLLGLGGLRTLEKLNGRAK